MEFRTEINLPFSDKQLSYNDKILTLGSCFADNIAKKLNHNKFNICSNPFGVLYNPISILNSVNLLLSSKTLSENDLILEQGEYHSFYHHSDFSHHKKETVLNNINNGLGETRKFLKNTTFTTITLGTSWIYKHLKKDLIVSNCHKIPANQFERLRLTVEEVSEALKKIIDGLRSINSDMNIFFTVSPIRHWKDGAVENMVSKSTLILGIQKVLESNVGYFPSYEIMMDDLRDYRFYEQDMLHPNQQAIDYIWEKFSDSYFSDQTKNLMKSVSKVVNACNHRPRNSESDKHQKFLKRNINLIYELNKSNPEINFEKELSYLKSLLI